VAVAPTLRFDNCAGRDALHNMQSVTSAIDEAGMRRRARVCSSRH
jgi:hypothetical protein